MFGLKKKKKSVHIGTDIPVTGIPVRLNVSKLGAKPARTGVFTIYQDIAGEYRWTLTAGNGRVIADSSESYRSPSETRDAVKRVQRYAITARVEEE